MLIFFIQEKGTNKFNPKFQNTTEGDHESSDFSPENKCAGRVGSQALIQRIG